MVLDHSARPAAARVRTAVLIPTASTVVAPKKHAQALLELVLQPLRAKAFIVTDESRGSVANAFAPILGRHLEVLSALSARQMQRARWLPRQQVQWFKLAQAWRLMEESERRAPWRPPITAVVKIRADGVLKPAWDAALFEAAVRADVVYAVTDHLFFGGRAQMAVAARLFDAIESWFVCAHPDNLHRPFSARAWALSQNSTPAAAFDKTTWRFHQKIATLPRVSASGRRWSSLTSALDQQFAGFNTEKDLLVWLFANGLPVCDAGAAVGSDRYLYKGEVHRRETAACAVTPPPASAARARAPRHPPIEGAAAAAGGGVGIGLVVPVHPPKMRHLCALVESNRNLSMPMWAVLSERAHARRLRCDVDWIVVPEFAGNLTKSQRSYSNTNIPTAKKWLGIRRVFDLHPSMRVLVAIDAETLLLRAPSWRDAQQFERDAAVVTYGARPATWIFREINERSCRAVGLPPIPGAAYMWWGDAPIYFRRDFTDFYGRIRWAALASVGANRVFDHISYLCYLHHVRGWRLVHANAWLERPHCLTHVGHHRLLWRPHRPAHSPCAHGDPLLAFHVDRFSCAGGDAKPDEWCTRCASTRVGASDGWCASGSDDLAAPAPAPGSSPNVLQ